MRDPQEAMAGEERKARHLKGREGRAYQDGDIGDGCKRYAGEDEGIQRRMGLEVGGAENNRDRHGRIRQEKSCEGR